MANAAWPQRGFNASSDPKRAAKVAAAPLVKWPGLSAAAGMMAVILFALPDPAAALDHFDCYKIRQTSFPRFARRSVALTDQFATTSASVVRPRRFCNPSDKNGSGITDPTAHLMCYQIREPRFTRRDVVVRNQFGDLSLRVLKPESLCVPAAKDNVPVVSALDHFKCYKVRGVGFQPLDVTVPSFN